MRGGGGRKPTALFPACNRRQQRYFISICHAGVELGVMQVDRRERALGDGAGAWKLLPDAPHHVADCGGGRHRPRRVGPPPPPRLARGEPHPHRTRPRRAPPVARGDSPPPPALGAAVVLPPRLFW